jgi:ribonuclease-3
LADALEALFGAILLDADFAASEQVVLNLFVPYLEEVDVQNLGKDAKTRLQEYLQSKHMPLPNYNMIAVQGEAHAQSFEVECAIPSLRISARGSGTSRRNAEQQAAQAAYQQLSAAK